MQKARLQTIGPRIRKIDTRVARIPPKTADAELLTPEHRAWRRAVLERAGYRCEALDAGQRCQVRRPSPLVADHIHERRDGGSALDASNGQCLCYRHHALKTQRARVERFRQRTG